MDSIIQNDEFISNDEYLNKPYFSKDEDISSPVDNDTMDTQFISIFTEIDEKEQINE